MHALHGALVFRHERCTAVRAIEAVPWGSESTRAYLSPPTSDGGAAVQLLLGCSIATVGSESGDTRNTTGGGGSKNHFPVESQLGFLRTRLMSFTGINNPICTCSVGSSPAAAATLMNYLASRWPRVVGSVILWHCVAHSVALCLSPS